jgi:hypothetical protein
VLAAIADIDNALSARQIGRATTLMFAMTRAWVTHTSCGNYTAAKAEADELVALAAEKGAMPYEVMGVMYRGCLFALTGKPSDAVALIASGCTAYRSTAATIFMPFFLLPNLLKVPGVQSVARMEGEPFAISISGEERQVPRDGPRYSALFEIDGPHVLVSREWAKAVEAGRWSGEVRPFTRNRRHALYRLR